MENFTYKSADELNKMTADEQNKYVTDMKAYERKQNQEDIAKAVKTSVDEVNKTVNTKLEEVMGELDSIKETVSVQMSSEMKDSLQSVIKENFDTIKEAFKNGKDFKFEIAKVAAVHMTNNGTITNASGLSYPTNPNFEMDREISLIRFPDNFALGLLNNRRVDNVPYTVLKRQQLPTEGAVAVTAEGGIKPMLQFKVQNTATNRKKYAGHIEYTEEFQIDANDLLEDFIDLFEKEIVRKWEAGIWADIDTNATAYVGSALDGTLVNPDNALAVIAGGLQIESLNYRVTDVVMNPQDVASAYYTQDSLGNFSLKPYVDANGRTIGAGYRLTTNNAVPVGTAYVGDFGIYKERHSGIIMRRGQKGDQLITNEYTIVGEVFSVLNAAPLDYKGIIKINLATVKAALKKASA